MAYLNLTDYEIYQNIIDDIEDDCVEIDDLIAPIIQLLNMKGYRNEKI